MRKLIFIFIALISCSTASDDSPYNYGPPIDLEQSCLGALECLSWCEFDSICNMECADNYPDHWSGARKTLLTCDLEPNSSECIKLVNNCN